MIDLFIDYGFPILAALIYFKTPKESQYKIVNLVLALEFILCLGIDSAIFSKGYVDGIWFDVLKTILNFSFVGIFLMVGGNILARVSGAICFYHILRGLGEILGYTAILSYSYSTVMLLFMVVQLLCGLRGMLHGVCYKLPSDRLERFITGRGHR